MNPLSDRINNLSTSQTLAMAALARELKSQGKDIISLSLGEPDFNTPEFIKEAAKKAQNSNQFSGGGNGGNGGGSNWNNNNGNGGGNSGGGSEPAFDEDIPF